MAHLKKALAGLAAAGMVLAGGAALAAGPAEVPVADFALVDVDKDGKITKEEFVKVFQDRMEGERKFVVLDANGDGYLVKEEWKVTAQKMDPKGQPAK